MQKLIKQINFPSDLRKHKKEDLKQISDELRNELIEVVSETGGHLGAGLGVVELTIALIRFCCSSTKFSNGLSSSVRIKPFWK